MTELDLKGKKVVMREDLNVPMQDGLITSDTRIRASLTSIRKALDMGAAVIVLSHLGRPEEGTFDPAASLAPVAKRLSELLGMPVPLIADINQTIDVAAGACVICENLRFLKGEKKNTEALAKQLAGLGDVYVMDAFATAHRAQASTEGALHYAKEACVGPLMAAELEALTRILAKPAHPLLAILGGSKISTKLEVLGNLAKRVDQLIVGGGIANTFLKAAGYGVGASLCEHDLLDAATRIMDEAKTKGAKIILPVDLVVAKAFSADVPTRICALTDVQADDMILDVGPKTVAGYAELVAKAGMIVWNGPLGAFEIDAFSAGTKGLAEAVAVTSAYTVVGGGDSIAALEKYGLKDGIDYISTAGGAFLEMLEGKTLPAVAALEAAAKA